MSKPCCVLFFSVALAGLTWGEVYNVNHLLDESLKDLGDRLRASEDVTASYDRLTLDGYGLQEVSLANLTTLKRTGDSYMWNDNQTVTVNGTLTLSALFVTAARLTAPNRLVHNPLITTTRNYISFQVNILLDYKYACKVTYDFAWSSIDGVTLYSEDKDFNTLDITNWVKNNLPRVNSLLVPAVVEKLREHMNMCEPKYLSAIEMTKYKYDFENIEQADMFYQMYHNKLRHPRL